MFTNTVSSHVPSGIGTKLSDELLDIKSSEEFKSRLTKLYYGG